MTGHVPFDANSDWTNPYCGNTSNDPLVDKLIGNAYHVVRTVYCNLGNLKLIYDFLNQYGMVLGVQSEAELKAMTTSASYVRLYGFDNTNKRIVTDYLYVEGDRTGVLPDDPSATGSWILVATSNSGGGGDDDGKASPPYIPYAYNNGSAIGGETTIPVPAGTVGVPMIVVEGYTNLVGYGFTYDAASLTVTLAQPLEPGDEVHLFLTGTPAVPDNPNVTDWIQINWLYNGGYASGGEQVIAIPYTFESVPAIYKNGDRYYAGLADKSYTVDAANQRILLTEPLVTNDRLIVTIGGESTTLIMSDRTVQEVARSANVKDSEVILSTNTTQYLNGMKVVYDVVAQKIYGLPTLPTNIYINSVSNGQLTYSPGNITVDLLSVPIEQLDDFKSELLAGTSGLVDSKAINVTPQGTLAEMHYYVTPDQFASLVPGGEYVDEDTNFTLAVQGAINYAAAHPGIVVRGTDKVYGTGGIVVTVGAKCIDSLKLKCVVASTDTLLYSFVDTGHTDLVIRNCDLNGNGNTRKGIIVSGVIRSTIEKNHVYGLDGTGEAYGIRIGMTSATSMNINNKISDNIIEMPTDPFGGTGSYAICGIGMIGQITTLYGGLDTNGGVAAFPSTITLRDTIISGNFISGGTHGVQGLGLFRALITKNHITTNTHRNINLSPNCQRVNIASNVLIEGGSSGVNVAWGCRWINITGNHIQTSTASVSPSDDAAIQLYKSVDQATVVGNTILGDWKYSVYMGAAVTNVTVQGNGLFAGSLASIAIESDWVLTATYPLAIYSSSRDPSVTPVATDTGNINIGGNAYGAGACAIYMTATNNRALYNVNIHDEVINSVTSRPHVIYAYDAGTLMTDGVLSNIAARGATAAKYYLNRGRGAFSVVKDITALDDPKAEVTVTGSTPSAVFGPNLYIASGTITDFTGSQAGDIINVRMNDGVILTHNTSVMRLKGGVNATASGGLAVVVLQRRAGVWFELSRNF
ncbi:MAG: hypothetical protein [Caudoviricetes sp.]|nr:MAG: hypothetical protein [Caudoviricetes sp.]